MDLLPQQMMWDAITMFFGNELCIYTTHLHLPDKPRVRLVVPLNSSAADEHQAIARRVAADIGIDMYILPIPY